jgi:hypothetical protein
MKSARPHVRQVVLVMGGLPGGLPGKSGSKPMASEDPYFQIEQQSACGCGMVPAMVGQDVPVL